jgi:putative tryptophan/tyrosine transport system substrate-binding protein
LYEELRRAGFVEGQNLLVFPGSYGLSADRLAPFAAELAKAKVDVIFAGGDPAIRAAQQATSTIPILALTDDILRSKLVDSLAHPGANTTGVSILATELDGKRQEILIEAVPGIRRMAALAILESLELSRRSGVGILWHTPEESNCRSIRSQNLTRDYTCD